KILCSANPAYVPRWMVWPICCRKSPRPAAKYRIVWPCAILPMSMMSASERCPCDERSISDLPRHLLSLRQPGLPRAATGALVAARMQLAALQRAAVADQPRADHAP